MGMFSIDENLGDYFDRKKIYRIWNNGTVDWDCYYGAIVVAENKDQARHIHPDSITKGEWWKGKTRFPDWIHPDKVSVEFIGYADNYKYKCGDVIMHHYKAG